MGMQDAIQLFFKNYTNFQGRSRRSEYWWVFLAYMIVIVAAALLIVLIGGGGESLNILGLILSGLLLLAALAVMVPWIALSVRRFHDLGQTGWLVLVFIILSAIPVVGLLASLGQFIWFAMPGATGPNKYGPDPKTGHDVGVFS